MGSHIIQVLKHLIATLDWRRWKIFYLLLLIEKS